MLWLLCLGASVSREVKTNWSFILPQRTPRHEYAGTPIIVILTPRTPKEQATLGLIYTPQDENSSNRVLKRNQSGKSKTYIYFKSNAIILKWAFVFNLVDLDWNVLSILKSNSLTSTYNAMTTVDIAVWYTGVVKTVNHKSSHHKKKIFSFSFFSFSCISRRRWMLAELTVISISQYL